MTTYEKIQTLKIWFDQNTDSEVNKVIVSLIKLYADELRDSLYKEADALGGIVTYKEVQIGLYQGKLEAVKEYKNRTGYPLLEAKRIVEKYFEDHNLKFARS